MYHDDDVDTPQENIERDVEVVTESLRGAFIERDQFQFTELWSRRLSLDDETKRQ